MIRQIIFSLKALILASEEQVLYKNPDMQMHGLYNTALKFTQCLCFLGKHKEERWMFSIMIVSCGV